jgi:DNA-binding NarL/FixJ family response regulator
MIVDDHVLVAKALSELIGEQDDMTVVGLAHSVVQ